MTQRINLQYSISLDELPAEVTRLLQTAFNRLQIAGAQDIPPKPLSLEAIEYLEEVRSTLATIDQALADISAIVNSYLDYQIRSRQAEEPTAVTDPQSLSQLDALTRKLEQFREENENSSQGSNS
jgi:hypothetical protein